MNITTDYLETYYEVVASFYSNPQSEVLERIANTEGKGGMWEYAKQLTDEFEEKCKGVIWGEELDWMDTLEEFLKEKLW